MLFDARRCRRKMVARHLQAAAARRVLISDAVSHELVACAIASKVRVIKGTEVCRCQCCRRYPPCDQQRTGRSGTASFVDPAAKMLLPACAGQRFCSSVACACKVVSGCSIKEADGWFPFPFAPVPDRGTPSVIIAPGYPSSPGTQRPAPAAYVGHPQRIGCAVAFARFRKNSTIMPKRHLPDAMGADGRVSRSAAHQTLYRPEGK